MRLQFTTAVILLEIEGFRGCNETTRVVTGRSHRNYPQFAWVVIPSSSIGLGESSDIHNWIFDSLEGLRA